MKRIRLNDRVLVQVKPNHWDIGTVHDIYSNGYIVLCDKYMNSNTNLIRITNKEDIKFLTTDAKHQ